MSEIITTSTFVFLAFFNFILMILGVKEISKNKFVLTHLQRKPIFSMISICYLENLIEKLVDGHQGWINLFITFGNYSPFMFTIITIMIFLPKKWLKPFNYFFSYMFFPMFMATIWNSFSFIIFEGKILYTAMSFDLIAHTLVSLYGLYLVISREVVHTRKTYIATWFTILLIPAIMVILNAIFDTAYFSLNLNGRHNIYNRVLTDNSYISMIFYFIGLTTLVSFNNIIMYFIQRKRISKEEKLHDSITILS